MQIYVKTLMYRLDLYEDFNQFHVDYFKRLSNVNIK